jgi:hypothetical protein
MPQEIREKDTDCERGEEERGTLGVGAFAFPFPSLRCANTARLFVRNAALSVRPLALFVRPEFPFVI